MTRPGNKPSLKAVIGLLILLCASVQAQPWLYNGSDIYYNGGKVGIGTSTPVAALDVRGSINAQGSYGTNFIGRRDAIPGSNAFLARFRGEGKYDASNYSAVAGEMAIRGDGSWSSTSWPTKIQFWTTPSGSTTELERMVIRNKGNVGIGTTSPSHKLHVNGDIRTGYDGYLYLGYTDVYWRDNSGNLDGSSENSINLNYDSIDNGTGIFQIKSGGSTVLKIDNAGNVGIGTSSPGYKLDVDGTVRIRNGWRGLKIEGSGSDPHRYDFIVGDLGGSPSYSGSFSIYDHTASAYRFAISKTGNVGIGTFSPKNKLDVKGSAVIGATYSGTNTAPSNGLLVQGNVGIGTISIPSGYKLAVDGKIICEEVKVKDSGSWPDHVLEAGYDLMPLAEVEDYIAEHQHLPDVPSAKEVAADGLSLGETQALLLQKIEELTLYVIDLKKENEALKERFAEIER